MPRTIVIHPAAKQVKDRISGIQYISTWSHSRLQIFEQCKYRAYLKYVQRMPEPERPLPPGKTEHANDRGTRIHENAELFVKGKAKLLPELRKHFTPEMEKLHAMYKDGVVLMEDEWAMSREWEAVDWKAKEAWLRLKLDALVFINEYEAVAVDLKTGRRQGNEIKHAEQVQLYQLVTFMRYPKLEYVHTELWYVDIDELFTQTYTRDQGIRFQRKFNERGNTITTHEFTGTEKDANPSMFTCKYCMYGPRGNGHCKRGV